ncbi:glycosyltransferase family 4 protein [soil metagenome]
MTRNARPTLLIVSQTFLPDPASVGQYMADVAIEMARRGHRVRVYAANRGYEDTSLKYLSRETIKGVEVRRLPLSSFGKKRILTRLVGTVIFMAQAFFVALFTPNLEGIFFSTSPPLIGVVLCIAAIIRRVPVAYWAMDLNPDQLIAMGKIKSTSLAAKILETANRFILRRSALVIALDRFMAERLQPRANLDGKLLVMPPWPHENHVAHDDDAPNPFREKHELKGKFVIMYSGNHSAANPLDTLLDATLAFKDDDGLRFLFVGGGTDKKKVERFVADHQLKNVICLPYQPLADLKYSLPAADVHVVSLGQDMVGIVHPCKIYGAMAVGRPVLFLGPEPSHIADILHQHDIGWHIRHGDTNGAIEAIRTLRDIPRQELAAKGNRARALLTEQLSQNKLQATLCDRMEQAFASKSSKGLT